MRSTSIRNVVVASSTAAKNFRTPSGPLVGPCQGSCRVTDLDLGSAQGQVAIHVALVEGSDQLPNHLHVLLRHHGRVSRGSVDVAMGVRDDEPMTKLGGVSNLIVAVL